MRPQATKIFLPPATGILGGGWALPGWARPVYIYHHPQPPAKCIRFCGISQSLYTRRMKINMLTGSRALGYSGRMFNKGIMKKEIIKELRSILKDYHYKSDTEHMSKDVVTSLENLLRSLLK